MSEQEKAMSIDQDGGIVGSSPVGPAPEGGEDIPHRVQTALARIITYAQGDQSGLSERVLNELLDVWEHHSILPTPKAEGVEPDGASLIASTAPPQGEQAKDKDHQ